MADLVRYVNTDNSASGDGTTNETDGSADSAYVSLSAANTALEAAYGNLVADGNTMTINCNGSAADTADRVDLDGWTTGASNRLTIQMLAGQEHQGYWDTSKYRLSYNNGYSAAFEIASGAEFCTVKGLQIENTGDISNAGIRAITQSTGGTQDVLVIGNIIRTTGTQSPSANCYTANLKSCTVVNNLFTSSGLVLATLYMSWPNTLDWTCYNNTCIGGALALDARGTSGGGTCRLFNNLADGATTDMFTNSIFTSDSNCTSDTSSPDGASFQSKTFTYVDSGSGDYHLAYNDTGARGLGTDLSGDSTYPFSTDIDGDTRAKWDVGADERAKGDVWINDTADLTDAVLQTYPTTWSDTSLTVGAVPDTTGLSGQLYVIVETASGAIAYKAVTVASGPTITDVNTTESWTDGDTGLVITGTNFV